MQTEPISKITNEKKDKALLSKRQISGEDFNFFVHFLENMNFRSLEFFKHPVPLPLQFNFHLVAYNYRTDKTG